MTSETAKVSLPENLGRKMEKCTKDVPAEDTMFTCTAAMLQS
jgi:hypothetical protein